MDVLRVISYAKHYRKITNYLWRRKQTRSFCYISDMVKGLIKLVDSDYNKPINIGSEMEMKIIDLASLIINNTYPDLKIDFHQKSKMTL